MSQRLHIPDQEILQYHLGGKVGIGLLKALRDQRTLSIAYTPGVAKPCLEIQKDPANVFQYTSKANMVAVVTDGTAVLGLGDIGPMASIPVMEGKAILFKAFAHIDAWPVPLKNCRTQGKHGPTDVDKLVDVTESLSEMYGGINLEDIAAPACFDVEQRLQERIPCPVFHDDQWGTAVITLAGLKNYAFLAQKAVEDLWVVINGAGAAGIRIAETIKNAGVRHLLLVDSRGVIHSDRADLNPYKQAFAVQTSKRTLQEAMEKADVFIGVSVPNCVNRDMILAMADYPAIFAMANPVPEISPEEVKKVLGKRAYIMATGRSDYPNQINNVLGFPYIFRGALDVQSKKISPSMKNAASEALAYVAQLDVPHDLQEAYSGAELSFGPHYIIPKPFDRRLLVEISYAVAKAACDEGNAAIRDLSHYRAYLEALAYTPMDETQLSFIIKRFVRFGYLHTLCLGHTPEGKKKSFICDPQFMKNFLHDTGCMGRPVDLYLKNGKIVKVG